MVVPEMGKGGWWEFCIVGVMPSVDTLTTLSHSSCGVFVFFQPSLSLSLSLSDSVMSREFKYGFGFGFSLFRFKFNGNSFVGGYLSSVFTIQCDRG